MQAWSDHPRARRGFFPLKNSTFLRNIVYFVCFKNINASCLRGGRRNLPNCPGPSPIAPRKKIPRAGKPLTPIYIYIYIYIYIERERER